MISPRKKKHFFCLHTRISVTLRIIYTQSNKNKAENAHKSLTLSNIFVFSQFFFKFRNIFVRSEIKKVSYFYFGLCFDGYKARRLNFFFIVASQYIMYLCIQKIIFFVNMQFDLFSRFKNCFFMHIRHSATVSNRTNYVNLSPASSCSYKMRFILHSCEMCGILNSSITSFYFFFDA